MLKYVVLAIAAIYHVFTSNLQAVHAKGVMFCHTVPWILILILIVNTSWVWLYYFPQSCVNTDVRNVVS